jgi:hypothetical protein
MSRAKFGRRKTVDICFLLDKVEIGNAWILKERLLTYFTLFAPGANSKTWVHKIIGRLPVALDSPDD